MMLPDGANEYSLKPLADDIAITLFAALRSRQLGKIGIDEIRAAINERLGGRQYSAQVMDMLEGLVTRKVVEITQ